MMTERASPAINAWKKTLRDLRVSLDAFVSATDLLCDSERRDNRRSPRPADVAGEDVYSQILEVYTELDGFEGKFGLDALPWELARAKIRNIRNQSHSIVAIHRLPDEVLSTIFILGFQKRIQDVGFGAVAGEAAIEVAGTTVHEEAVADVETDESEDSETDEDEEDGGAHVPEGDGTGAGAESGEKHEDRDECASREATQGKALPFNLLVSQVCHRWREVALNTGQLWTRIALSEPPPHERMKLWLVRSGNHPLDFFFDTHPPGMSSESLALTLLAALEHLKSSASQSAEPRCVNFTINARRSLKDVHLVLLELSLTHSYIRLQSLTVHERTFMCRPTHARYWKPTSLSEMLRV
ncbi:hypothetical protein BOTBODRAFT_191826 [Botryobasidium botryosum FD-172 SS1]|uniref:Uncharacterized protein n=1 Tax=Botryobasidium botryosum (strain FD-172 SS1) TaxID=930990 RepID=A0A067M0Z5_BOTB1|nr:hypothetical protein BOTBODRAFT_191826 [Botryobasidium botryosum FD-172 SS1]